MSKPRGLPSDHKMRHDTHFVDQLAAPQAASVGKMIDVSFIDPNPQQPRREIGDLTGLVSSIKEKGVLEPILVRRLGSRYQIIAGERRYHAAQAAGLGHIPCIEIDVDETGVLEISLIENLQRRDLDPFEEGDAILELCERFKYTHERIAKKLSKSRTSVTEILNIARLPESVRDVCRRADISSKSLLLEIARQPTAEMMQEFVERVAHDQLTRDDARMLRAVPKPEDREGSHDAPKTKSPGFVMKLQMEGVPATVHLRFAQPGATKTEIVGALRELIRTVEASDTLPD